VAKFDPAFDVVLEHEGGFSNHSADPGGATNFGISIRYLLDRGDLDGDGLPDGDVDGDGDVDIDDIKAITPMQAKALYHSGFWVPNRLQQVLDQAIATKIFDICVNTGSRQAWKITQRACNELGAELLVDGIIGPKTLEEVNVLRLRTGDPGATLLLDEIRSQQLAFYQALVGNRPELEVFLNGWTNRAMA
jgi:lysozyme family protein